MLLIELSNFYTMEGFINFAMEKLAMILTNLWDWSRTAVINIIKRINPYNKR